MFIRSFCPLRYNIYLTVVVCVSSGTRFYTFVAKIWLATRMTSRFLCCILQSLMATDGEFHWNYCDLITGFWHVRYSRSFWWSLAKAIVAEAAPLPILAARLNGIDKTSTGLDWTLDRTSGRTTDCTSDQKSNDQNKKIMMIKQETLKLMQSKLSLRPLS